MTFSSLFYFLSLFYPLAGAYIVLHPDGVVPNVFAECRACAPIERLRTPTYGIELSPEYITVGVKHANATLEPLLEIQPGYEFYEIWMGWMVQVVSRSQETVPPLQNHSSVNILNHKPSKQASSTSIEAIMRRHYEQEVLSSELRQVRNTVLQRFPELELKWGGVAIPDYIYRASDLRARVEDALSHSGLRNSRGNEFFQLYPTDFATIATTAAHSRPVNFTSHLWTEETSFDALVITNTSSYISASWYQFSLRQSSIGHLVEPQVHFAQMYDPGLLRQNVLESKPVSSKMRTLGTTAFVAKREVDFQKNTGAGKRFMSGHSRMILRFEMPSNEDNKELREWLDLFLKHTRFNPASLKTTIYREDKADWTWAPALYVARDMKSRVDYGEPFGCEEPSFCEEVKDCARREALGDLIICEDMAIPEPPISDRIQNGVRDDYMGTYNNHITPWLWLLLNEAEARIWLWHCNPQSAAPMSPRCQEAIEPISDTVVGVLEDYVDFTSSIIHTVARYWLTGNTVLSLLEMPLWYIGTENLLKVGFWALSSMLGPYYWEKAVERFKEVWENDFRAIWEAGA